MPRIVIQDHQKLGISFQLHTAPSDGILCISPPFLWVILSLTAIFISVILHLLLRFIKKNQSHPSISQSNRYNIELRHPPSIGRQLQHLFRLQDSGLDQSLIDRLPVFDYTAVSSPQDPFDCAVCLCEFSPNDKLRLIPVCSHAFHTHCIDTWLLSTPTCPLCRVNLAVENPLRNCSLPIENPVNIVVGEVNCREKDLGKRVLSVRLGKLTGFDSGERSSGGEISGGNLGRRCFSMGSFQYVVDDVDLQVALFDVKDKVGCGNKSEDGMDERKKVKYESFSVSKVWLWSKKGKFPVCSSEESEVAAGDSSSQNTRLPDL